MNPVDPKTSVPVAIIGIGCMFPKAEDLSAFWSNIRDRLDAITEVPETHWRPEDYFDSDPKSPDRTYARRGGFLNPVDFSPIEYGIAPNNLEATDTTQVLGLMVAKHALDDAGYVEGSEKAKLLDRSRVSVILGVTGTLELVIPLGARLGHPIWRRALKASGVDETTSEEVVKRIADSYVGWQENSFPGLLGNVAAGRIANRLDLGGTNCVIDAACASSIGALNLAILELSAGRCDVALSGGLDTFNDIFMYMCFSKTPALSPSGNAKPFDAGCDGTILGEGLGIVAIKRLDDAKRDGDTIYAVIKSVGSSSDGKGNAVYAPSAAGQTRALRDTYQQAGVSPETIELVEAHGTGTKVGDATELSALNEVYREAKADGTWCALGSVKSQIGHTKAAAGAAGLIKAALALHHKVLPPTIKVEKPLPGLGPDHSPFYVNVESRPWLPRAGHPRRAAVSAFGFGGSNFHCLLEEAEPAKAAIDWDVNTLLLAFSGPSVDAIKVKLDAFPRGLKPAELRVQAAKTRREFAATDAHRLLLVVDRTGDLESHFKNAKGALDGTVSSKARLKEGIFVGSGRPAGKLAFLFPGQGSQYVGMSRELACLFPQVQEALALTETIVGDRFTDAIYPLSSFTEAERLANDARLRATDAAQPAIAAVSLGLLKILDHFGVAADAFAGHSFGELTALRAAGWIDDAGFLKLARERGRLMAEQAKSGRGAMLAVLTTIETVEDVLRSEKIDLVIANRNAPRQFVLSGPTPLIAQAEAAFEARKATCRRLAVSAAFHSADVADASKPFLDAIRAVDFQPNARPVYANTTASVYPTDPDVARGLLAEQLARPVEFAKEIETLSRSGVTTFLEVGPDAKLAGLVRSILEATERPGRALAVDASKGSRGNLADLACTLAELAAIGYPIDLQRWDEGAEGRAAPARKPGMTVKICGANPGPRPSAEAPGNPQKPKPVATPPPSRPSVPTTSTPISTSTSTPTTVASPPMTTNSRSRPTPTPTHSATSNGTGFENRTSRVESVEHGHEHGGNGNGKSNGKPSASTSPAAMPSLIPIGSANPGLLAEALRNSQENLVALRQLGQQSADLHRQFLEGQEKSGRTFQTLLEQQQRLTLAALGVAPLPDSAPVVNTPPVSRTPAAVERFQPRAAAAPVARERVAPAPTSAPRPTPAPAPAPGPVASVKPVQAVVHQPNTAAAPAPRPAPIAKPAADSGKVMKVLLDVVAEKTGYPAEMLEPGMQLDADLGIDSIKRVEILSALQERLPEAPAIKPEHLGTLRTLADIAGFLNEEAETAVGSEIAAAARRNESAASGRIFQVLLEVVAEKTGYPAEMLEPGMQLDADLGIDSIKRVEILSALQERLPEAPAIKPEHLGSLRTLKDIVEFLAESGPSPETAPLAVATVPTPESETRGVIRLVPRLVPLEAAEGVPVVALRERAEFWLVDDGSCLIDLVADELGRRGISSRRIGAHDAPSLQAPASLDGLVLFAPQSVQPSDAIKDAFRILRAAAPGLRASAKTGGAILATIGRLDGGFGFEATRDGLNPATGGLAGLAKSAKHEWPEVHCKAIDLDPALGNGQEAAALLVDEILRGNSGEVGIGASRRKTLSLETVALNPEELKSPPITSGELVVVTGGARGVTAEVAVALAEAYRPTLVLLGRSPVPETEPNWLAHLQDETEIKRALASRANGHGSPQLIGEQFRKLAANREIRQTIARIEAAGAKAVYIAADVRDSASLRQTLDRLRAEHGPIRGLVHGAGVLADRKIEDQTDEQFAGVIDTKVDGINALLEAVGPLEPRFIVLFSSTTARLGRKGQVAYAAANETLNKIAQRESRNRHTCRVVAINWGPWDGGMVTASLKPLFAAENVGLIPLAEGARYLVDELRSSAKEKPVEIVILGNGSRVEEFASGFVTESKPAHVGNNGHAAPASATALTVVFERPLDPEAIPILESHAIDGRGVLPFALTLEWLGQGAIQRNPGLAFVGIDELRLLKGAVAHENRPETLAVCVAKSVREGSVYHAAVELRGNHEDGRSVVHARGTVILADRLSTATSKRIDPGSLQLPAYARPIREVYHDILFHGPDLHGIERIDGFGPNGFAAQIKTGAAPSTWIERPLRQGWLSDPLAIDSAFQLMVLWSFEQTGAPSLPTKLGTYRQFQRTFPTGRVKVVAKVHRPAPHRETADIEFVDANGAIVARIEGYECVSDASLNQAFRRNKILKVARAPR